MLKHTQACLDRRTLACSCDTAAPPTGYARVAPARATPAAPVVEWLVCWTVNGRAESGWYPGATRYQAIDAARDWAGAAGVHAEGHQAAMLASGQYVTR